MHAVSGFSVTGFGIKVAVIPYFMAVLRITYLIIIVASAILDICPSMGSISNWPEAPTSG